MNDESSDGRPPTFSEGYVVPITGLLSLLFAVMAGITAYPAISGAPGGLAVPVTFGAASIAFMYLRQRHTQSRGSDDGEGP